MYEWQWVKQWYKETTITIDLARGAIEPDVKISWEAKQVTLSRIAESIELLESAIHKLKALRHALERTSS